MHIAHCQHECRTFLRGTTCGKCVCITCNHTENNRACCPAYPHNVSAAASALFTVHYAVNREISLAGAGKHATELCIIVFCFLWLDSLFIDFFFFWVAAACCQGDAQSPRQQAAAGFGGLTAFIWFFWWLQPVGQGLPSPLPSRLQPFSVFLASDSGIQSSKHMNRRSNNRNSQCACCPACWTKQVQLQDHS